MNANVTTPLTHKEGWGMSLLKTFAMMLILLSPVWANEAAARDCYLKDTWRYTVTLEGTNQLRLSMPLYDKDDSDCWIVEGTIYIQIEGLDKETLFYYEAEHDINSGDYCPYIYCYKGVDGNMTLYRERGYSNASVGTSKKTIVYPCLENQNYAIVNALWDIPNKYRGKKVIISWSIHHNGNTGESNYWPSISSTSITIPSAPELQLPMVMDPIISYDAGHPNQMMVPYMIAANKIKSMKAYYNEVYTSKSATKSIDLGTSSSDFVRLPANVCISDFYVQATYEDSENKEQTTRSTPMDLPVLHLPQALSVALQPNGKALLEWKVNYPNWNDLSSSDTWEIQRNITGDPTNSEWISLGQINFDEKATTYEFEDESLLAAYQGHPVYYRVRRVITAIWGWTSQNGYAMTQLPATMALPAINQATVSRSDSWSDASHKVTLNYGIGAREIYDKEGRFILRDSTDWKTFVNLVKEAKGEKDVNAIMAADISTIYAIGSQDDIPYRGTFDGNGHTLTVDINGGEFTAPFTRVKTSTFKNLHVCGKVSGGIHSAGLVGCSTNGATITIENCHISTHVTGTGNANNPPHSGGIIGHGRSAKNIIRNCLFDGSITAVNTPEHDMSSSYAGAFVGWEDGGTSNVVENNLEQGTYNNFKHVGANYNARNSGTNWGGTNNYNSNNWGECNKAAGLTVEQIVTALGAANWQVYGTNAIPIMKCSEETAHKTFIWDNRAKVVLNTDKTVGDEVRYTERRVLTNQEIEAGTLEIDLLTSCVDHNFRMIVEQGESNIPLSVTDDYTVTKTDQGDLAIYTFDNNVILDNAKADTLQNAVSLSWEAKRGQADYYRILRYDKLTPDSIVTLESAYEQKAYIDNTVRPQHNYVYIIEGVTLCEGQNVSRITVEGCCVPTGAVRGYVRLSNGIGLPGYTVTAEPIGNIIGGEILTCITDSAGYFEIDSLVYQKYGSYSISVSDPTKQATFTSQIVTFDEDINLHTNIVFYQQNYYTFSGYVLYDGSSIPVSGVQFLRDGVPVINSMGQPVTTNHQGAFEVSVPQGSHRIQVVKDGHVFKNEGFYITPDAKPDSTWHNWDKDVSGIYLWDETKVNLQGRVVGGNDQGLLELGKSLSKNNLGIDLTIVMQLEGDNTSWIVRDQLDPTITERHEKHAHGVNDTTEVDLYRHRIEIHPDLTTGEYKVPLYPVKYKVTEIYAKGYPTLFQTGMVSETIDLNRYIDGDTATYSRIYHSQPTLDIWQFNGTQDRYYGIKQYTALDNAGIRDTVILWHDGKYALGYPVFMSGASVPMLLSAREEYRFNNEEFGDLDIVQLNGGKVTIGNGLVAVDQIDEVELDSDGQGTYVFTPQNTTFTLDGDMSQRTMKFTLLYDGSYYDMEPINAYIMAATPKPQGRRIIAGQNTHLIDILRDPPGGGSSAYIEKGSKFSYSYEADYTFKIGANMTIGIGSGSNFYTGVWIGTGVGTMAGPIVSSDNHVNFDLDLTTAYHQEWSYNYEFETKEKITTSDHVKEVGANADVYIGMTDNVIVEDAIAVRVVPSKTLKRLMPAMGRTTVIDGHEFDVAGTAKILACGWDDVKNDSIYLIRDEVMQFYSKIQSTFAHSQGHILEEIIPSLIRTRNSLLMDSTTTATYAQSLANNMKYPVYVSNVSPENENYSLENYYTKYLPSGMSNQWNDSILALNNQIATWAGFIAANEKEKLEATEIVKVYDFDGRSNVEYSENFTTTDGMHRYWKFPSVGVSGDGVEGLSKQSSKGGYTNSDNPQSGRPQIGYEGGGVKFTLSIAPVLGFDFNYNNGMSEEFSKGTGFTLSCARKSNLNVAVYKTKEISADSIAKLQEVGDMGFFYKNVEDNLKSIYNGRPGSSNTTSYIESLSKVPRYRNFVFRTLGGATASPWEDERKTLFYNTGAVLDQKTMEIDQLRIWAKEPIVSNVPFDEPARFTIYMTNESEFPERVTNELKYYLEDTMNPKGAKVVIDGCPLTGSGQDLWLEPNTIIEKQVEVLANSEYDYENIGISFFNENDVNRIKTVNISAHFVPSAGKINISKPGNNWVVNTESAFDKEEKSYYLPVHIDGFNVNFRNFDHIELQYKLSTQGDKDWVNVCSYYRNDEEGKRLMELASGERKLMDHDGYIDAFFYGETDPIEQYYDIRAVTFCRHGNGYLTSSSNILTGIKDTRRPVPFGTPQPTNGILGIGDDIKIAFSEPIAGNYLSAINNFQVLGMTNSSNISLSTSLHFTGKSMAQSQAARNLVAKDFTFDVMLNPEETNKDMVVLTHGQSDHNMTLGLTADRRMMATIEGHTMVSDSVINFTGLRQVAYVVDNLGEKCTKVTFYDGNTKIGEGEFPDMYYGKGNLTVGYDSFNYPSENNFVGDMLEMRLWNKAMSKSELGSYAQKRLTGYELGLLDNYSMNEGKGFYTYDKAVGSNDLILFGTTWKVPDGISIKLDGKKGVKMEQKFFQRKDYEDYTLMFWFRTRDDDGTLIANGQAQNELGWKDHFNIGLEEGDVYFRSGGQQVKAGGNYSEGSWHHVAIAINRARNVGNLYVDQALKQTFPVDTLGGISGNNLYLGATYTDANTPTALLEGNIDEVAMYEMSLSENVLKNYANITPAGSEMGTMLYLPFSRNETQSDNSQRLMPTGISLRRYTDNHGNIVESHRDTIVSPEVIDAFADRTNYAPMKNIGNLENIKFSYVADGKDLLLNLDVPDYQLEKTNVYLTVKDVADLQGNLMASPVVMDLYVYRNPLRWSVKRKTVEAMYGDGATVDLTIENLSGKSQSYTLEGLPMWITASQTSGTISALSEEQVTLTISPYINVGTFNEVITIVGENGMTEPLPLNICIRGEEPNWVISNEMMDKNLMMHIVARVIIDGEVVHNPENILAVFGPGHEVMGATHIDVDNTTGANEGLAYLNVYYKEKPKNPIPLRFEFYNSETGLISVVKPQGEWIDDVWHEGDSIFFDPDTIIGTSAKPLVLTETYEYVQTLKLHKGWNWLSFYVQPHEGTITELLDGAATWEVGDGLEVINAKGNGYLFTYKAMPNPDDETSELYYWNKGTTRITLDPRLMYRFYVRNEKTAYLGGYEVSHDITVRNGWNRIGFISSLNLPIATALAEYTDEGSEGDIIKSQSEFAVLNIDAQGNRYWKGSLKYLRAGEGYMIRHNGNTEITFSYPYYNKSRYSTALGSGKQAPLFRNNTGSSMNIIAQVEGIELEEGDRLVAYMGAETVGIAEAGDEGLFFLTVGQGNNNRINFTIEHDGEIIATTSRSMPYIDNSLSGSIDEPTIISFTESDLTEGEGWYTVSGIRLAKKPNTKGVFIHNGQKVTIK